MILFLEIIAVIIIVYSAFGWTLYFLQPKLVFQPLREVLYTPEDLGINFEKVTLKPIGGVKITGRYVPVKHHDFTVLFCHPNGGNMMNYLDSVNLFHKLGVNFFIFDYRGFGNSRGKLTEEGTYTDAETAYHWLVNEKKIPPSDIIIFGRSLGGSVAAHLASRVKAAGLVVESSFTSYPDMGKKFYPYMPVRWFSRFNYNTLEYIKKVHCPIMVVHSRSDEITPFEFGLELYESSNQPNEFTEIFGSHNDGFLVSSEVYKKAWRRWLKSIREYQEQLVARQYT